jgi:preprotein translocase subunit YajC
MIQFLEGTVPAGGMGSSILMIVAMIGIFYFMLIRPENKRKKEAEQTRKDTKVGDQVTTIGGIIGTVVNVKEDKFVMETGADQVRIEFAKWAISSNDTAVAAANEAAKKAREAKAKAKAVKKAEKGK